VVLTNSMRIIEAEATLRGARAIAAELQFADAEVRACVNIGFVLSDFPKRAFAVSREGAALAFRLGMRSYLPFLLVNASDSGLPLGEWDAASELLTAGRELSVDPAFVAQIDAGLVVLDAYRGQDVGSRVADLEALSPRNDPQARAGLADTLAHLAMARGDYPAVIQHIRDAVTDAGDAYGSVGRLLAGRARLWTGDVVEARAIVEQSSQPLGGYGQAGRLEILAGVAALEGRLDDAAEQFAATLRAYEELDLVFERALCQLTMVAVLPPSRHDASAAAVEARAVLERLGAAPWLARLDELLAKATVGSRDTARSSTGELADSAAAR
jgi:GNAT superfamily N-acetyltransferase